MIIKGACPNCGGPISEERLKAGLPCRKCLPTKYLSKVKTEGLRSVIMELGKARKLIDVFLLEDELRDFGEFFRDTVGKELWTIQRAWAKRMLAGESFALIAPTGVGKTTLLQVYALYKAREGSNVLYIVPTRELMKQVITSLRNLSADVVVNDSSALKGTQGKDLRKGRIDVLTHAFIFRNKDLFRGLTYNTVIVDDFDALLKSSSLIDLILNSMGVDQRSIELARKAVSLKSELMFYKYAGNEERAEQVSQELYNVEAELASSLDVESIGQLLIASATGRAKGSRVKVLREILGFEVGSIMDYLRNIVEVVHPLKESEVPAIVSRLTGGTLVFVSKDLGLKKAREIVEELRSHGLKAMAATSRKALDMLRSGEVDVLVGVSTYYGILTRGIDEPLRIYNTVFVGIPKFDFAMESLLTNPRGFIHALMEAAKKGYELTDEDKDIVRTVSRLSPGKIRVLQAGLRGYVEVEGFLADLKSRIEGAIPRLMRFISSYVRKHGKMVTDSYIVRFKSGRLVASMPDVMTYIQASGRCSRLLKGSMTLGLSILLYEDKDLLEIFSRKLSNYVAAYEPKPLSSVDLEEVARKQRESREKVVEGSDVKRIKSVLIVVESPTKAKTIARMFGRPGRRYLGEYIAYETVIPLKKEVLVATLAPTLGHLLDLTVNEGFHGLKKGLRGLKPVYTTIKRCASCGYQFTDDTDRCPRCGSSRIRDSRKVIEALRKLAQEADEVLIATDPDDEGEKIAYDVYLLLRPYVNSFKRIEFHEVTRQGFMKALLNPRQIDSRRVDAQIVRRVDDRLIGFELSGVLKTRLNKHWLGGGRVQTPVLEWIVERYRKYLEGKGYLIIVSLPEDLRITYFTKDKELAKNVVKHLEEEPVYLRKISEEVKELSPKPPYTTDTLLYEGMRYLRLPPGKVMRIAQDLFELGFITYHRTDSTHVSPTGMQIAKEFLQKMGLSGEMRLRGWGREGTHECIRPTKALRSLDEMGDLGLSTFNNLTWYHKRLYDLIVRRFIASQMTPAKVRSITLEAALGPVKTEVTVITEVIDEGFLKVDPTKVYTNLLKVSEVAMRPKEVRLINASELRLFTASDIVKLMKERNIGRPSTYAKAVENNLRHGYVIASKKRLYLIPTKLGMEVADLIKRYYPDIADVHATRELEKLLDHVRSGRLSRSTALILLLSEVVRIRVRDEISQE
ncbi:MAG: reverse gyrase, partial [Desulfurococcales archaeon]|nr:reverse gyrase [Desulfurococcales archaeon]